MRTVWELHRSGQTNPRRYRRPSSRQAPRQLPGTAFVSSLTIGGRSRLVMIFRTFSLRRKRLGAETPSVQLRPSPTPSPESTWLAAESLPLSTCHDPAMMRTFSFAGGKRPSSDGPRRPIAAASQRAHNCFDAARPDLSVHTASTKWTAAGELMTLSCTPMFSIIPNRSRGRWPGRRSGRGRSEVGRMKRLASRRPH